MKTEAFNRSENVSNVSYQLAISVKKGGGVFNGVVVVAYQQKSIHEGLFIDYNGQRVKSLRVNGAFVKADAQNVFIRHKIFIP